VGATQVVATSLSAISANLGTITGGSITGATIQTSASGNQVVLSTSNAIGFYFGGTQTASISDAGDVLALTAGTAAVQIDPVGTFVNINGSLQNNGTTGYITSAWGSAGTSIGLIGGTNAYTRTLTINGVSVTVVTTN
jgi:hypothetical protein